MLALESEGSVTFAVAVALCLTSSVQNEAGTVSLIGLESHAVM